MWWGIYSWPPTSGSGNDGVPFSAALPSARRIDRLWNTCLIVILSKRLIGMCLRQFAQFGLDQAGEGNFDVSAIVHFDKGRITGIQNLEMVSWST